LGGEGSQEISFELIERAANPTAVSPFEDFVLFSLKNWEIELHLNKLMRIFANADAAHEELLRDDNPCYPLMNPICFPKNMIR
jgi:hypothetical protein